VTSPCTRELFEGGVEERRTHNLRRTNRIRYYDPNQPMGSRFSEIVANSTVDRMYHSSATLLPGALRSLDLGGN
jgi:hypothetical protein